MSDLPFESRTFAINHLFIYLFVFGTLCFIGVGASEFLPKLIGTIIRAVCPTFLVEIDILIKDKRRFSSPTVYWLHQMILFGFVPNF